MMPEDRGEHKTRDGAVSCIDIEQDLGCLPGPGQGTCVATLSFGIGEGHLRRQIN